MAGYADWVAGIEAHSGCDAEFWRCGMNVLDVERPDTAMTWCDAHGLATEPIRTAGGNGLRLPAIAQVRNPRLVAALREAVTRLGAAIHPHSPVRSVTTQAGRITAVHTAEDRFAADQFVLATGAWSGLGWPGLAGVPNVRPIRGQMLLFRVEPGTLETILYRRGLYLIPRRDGHLLVGSTLEDVGFDKSTDAATRVRLHAGAAELLPALSDAQPIQHWAGLRPGSPDNIPIIDRHPDFDNVYVNAGHFRYGVTLAPASSELLADLIEGRTPALDPAPYRWQAAAERNWTLTQ
jgi:glycine oxidase